MILTYRYRVKNLNGLLNSYSRAVNFVWNYCNDVQKHSLRWGRRWPSGFDLINLTSGISKELKIPATTINEICRQYAKSISQKNRPYLRYRGRRSLGWVPFRAEAIRADGQDFVFYGSRFKVFNSRSIPEDARIKDGGSFSQDAKGNWYLNIVLEIAEPETRVPAKQVGIDLGLKDFATLSTGDKVANTRHFRSLEKRLAVAQRANKRRQALNIHTKIKNRRRDELHKLSNRLTKEFDYIAVGNVNAAGLKKTKLAKSVSDAGWSTFRNMLAYKSIRNGAVYQEVNEAWSTQTCSQCGAISGPKGQSGLNKRMWSCSGCGHNHDRDVNAAICILRLGQQSPVLGIAA
jgi:IS605 OrfB family transposase